MSSNEKKVDASITRKNRRKYLTDQELFTHIKKFEKWSRKLFRNAVDHEDCVGWVTEHMVKDHSRTYSYYCSYVDYMRAKFGRNGHKLKIETNNELYEDTKVYEEDADFMDMDPFREIALMKALDKTQDYDRIMLILGGMNQRDASNALGLSEPVISTTVSKFNIQVKKIYDRLHFVRQTNLNGELKKWIMKMA